MLLGRENWVGNLSTVIMLKSNRKKNLLVVLGGVIIKRFFFFFSYLFSMIAFHKCEFCNGSKLYFKN